MNNVGFFLLIIHRQKGGIFIKKKLSVKKIIAVIFVLLLLIIETTFILGVFIGSVAQNMGDTGNWSPGYASPRQYYEENGANLVSTTKTIDGIIFTFDDIGNAIQNETEGVWEVNDRYRLESGTYLKNMWYQIDGDWYFFNKKGVAEKFKFIKVNKKKYFTDEFGRMCTGSFRTGRYRYCAKENGELVINEYFRWENADYETNMLGHASKIKGTVETEPDPAIMWEGNLYIKDKPAYYFKDQYTIVGKTGADSEAYPQNDGESIQIAAGSEIYFKDEPIEVLYIYDKTDNSFYSYMRSELLQK